MIEELFALRLTCGAFIGTTIIATILWMRERARAKRNRHDYGRTKI